MHQNTGSKLFVLVLTTLLASSAAAAPVAAHQGHAYAGANIHFSMESNAVTDYQVDGTTVFDSVAVQSQDEAEGSGVVGASGSLRSMTSVHGSSLSTEAKTEAKVTITAESGATMEAHDDEHGILVVDAGGTGQYVAANLSDGTTAESSGEKVVVTAEDGSKGTFLVVGDGNVTVNENGDVSAKLGQNGQLVYRSYPSGERDESDEKQEDYIQEGKATAEVYVFEKGGEYVSDTVTYGEGTTVEVTQKSTGEVVMTADRAESEGTVIITSVSDALVSNADDVQVRVDGSAAAEASSYSELSGAVGGDGAKYMVSQTSEAEAGADVLVAVSHFSERTVTVTDGSGGSGEDTATDAGDGSGGDDAGGADGTSTNGPGFGAGVAVAALLGAALVAVRRQ